MIRLQKLKAVLNWKILAILYTGIFLTIMLLAYTGNLPPGLTRNDKLAHFVLYGIATYFGHQILKQRRIRLGGYPIPLFPFLFGSFTVVEELLQSFSPHRSVDAMDLVASFMGIWLGYWLADRTRSRKNSS